MDHFGFHQKGDFSRQNSVAANKKSAFAYSSQQQATVLEFVANYKRVSEQSRYHAQLWADFDRTSNFQVRLSRTSLLINFNLEITPAHFKSTVEKLKEPAA